MSRAVSQLEDGEELSEEDVTEIAKKVRSTFGGEKKAQTSVTESGSKKAPGNPGEVSLDQFCSMSIAAKSKLYSEQPELYNELFSQAKAAKKLL